MAPSTDIYAINKLSTMNHKFTTLSIIVAICMTSCVPKHNALTIVDDSLNPIGSQNQLVLAPDRGELGHYCYSPNGSGALEHYNSRGFGTKQWVIKNWGAPDRLYSERGVEYLIYERRSKVAPNYRMQYLGGERPVKLGYRNGKLIYVSAYFRNCPSYMKGPVYVLPR